MQKKNITGRHISVIYLNIKESVTPEEISITGEQALVTLDNG